jgi:hypothetical protein
VGAVVGAMLGLLAFMLAFTFGLAATRFDARRMAVLEEANAIGTTYQRAGLLEEPYRSQVRSILREYVDMRVAGVLQGTYEQTIIRSEELQRQLWAQAEVLGRKHPRESIIGLFIQSLNSLMDLHAKRVMLVMRNHIPGSIWIALYLISSLAMGGMGYHAGLSGSKRSPIILSLALTFSLIILLIADLDLPQEGLLDVSEQSMIDVRNMMIAPTDPGKVPRQPSSYQHRNR